MTTITTHCEKCDRDIRLESSDVLLKVCPDVPMASFYEFVCSLCGEQSHRHADDHLVSLLMSGGVRAEVWEIPAEVLEPKNGDAITRDDLLDFVQQLASADDAWWAEL